MSRLCFNMLIIQEVSFHDLILTNMFSTLFSSEDRLSSFKHYHGDDKSSVSLSADKSLPDIDWAVFNGVEIFFIS